jgi:hypothetical protein
MEPLKPCPFCGNSASFAWHDVNAKHRMERHENKKCRKSWFVVCNGCGARTLPNKWASGWSAPTNKTTAIEKWNTRHG